MSSDTSAAERRFRDSRELLFLGARAKADLSDLGLLVEATRDPFSGDTLRVKKVTGGWLVYSVGADLNDDGGDEKKDVVLAPPAD